MSFSTHLECNFKNWLRVKVLITKPIKKDMKSILSISLLVIAPLLGACTSSPKVETKTDVVVKTSEDKKDFNTNTNETSPKDVKVKESENKTVMPTTNNTASQKKVQVAPKVVKKVVEAKKENIVKKVEKEVVKEKEVEKKVTEETKIKKEIVALPNHQVWDKLLAKYVTVAGNVDYDGLKSQHKIIKSYIKSLQELPPTANWDKNEELAYWINLYNALTVNLILDKYPIKSIMDINGGKAWDLEVIQINGKSYSLNDIEHNTIRKKFKEPRIHFAVNCAAASCPKLLNGAFLPAKIEQQLDKQARYFINNTNKNKISSSTTELSQIFNWYGSDFGDIKKYINKYHKDFNSENTVSYLEYDWKLNK